LTGKCFSLTGKYFRWPIFLMANKHRKVWKVVSRKVNSGKQTWPKLTIVFLCLFFLIISISFSWRLNYYDMVFGFFFFSMWLSQSCAYDYEVS
jgi:hypothetical protein